MDYVTNAILLDVLGGGRLPGKDRTIAEPASILLLDGEGKLVVRSELDDLAEYRFHKPPEEREVAGTSGATSTKPKRGGRGGPGSGSAASMSDYAEKMGAGMGSGMPGTSKKSAKRGGTASGLLPGMTQGMMSGSMPGGPGMGMGDLDDKPGKKKKKSR